MKLRKLVRFNFCTALCVCDRRLCFVHVRAIYILLYYSVVFCYYSVTLFQFDIYIRAVE
jgi:hypothetical protein